MASSKPIPCGPCKEGKVDIKADIWCYSCDEGLCSICSGHHKRSKLSRDHKTVEIKSDKPTISAIKTICDKHGQKLNLFCPSHLMPCCDECISTSHSKCTGIKSLDGVVEKTKIEKLKESLDKDMNSVIHILNEIMNNKSENIKRGEQQYESIKETVAKFRKKINKHLDYLEKKLYQETDTALNKEKSKASILITEINEKKEKLNEMKDQLQAVTTHSSKLQSFLGVHQIEQQVHQYQRFVEDLGDDDRTKEFDIKMKQNDEVEKTFSKLGSYESLGEVIVVKTEIAVNRETSVRTEAQVQSQEQSNINNMTMNIETKIQINLKSVISDMICLMDGRVIVIEDRVSLLTSDGKCQKQLHIPGQANCVTQINQDTIAITFPLENAIKIFNMENERVTKVITLNKKCWGLSFSDRCLVVGVQTKEIRFIDLDGNTLKSIEVLSRSPFEKIVSYKNRVIFGDCSGKAVYCVDGSGKQIWEYKHDLSFPTGLCTDTYGNIFVADYESGRIKVISKDGDESKVLISKGDGLNDIWSICFKHNESSGFICDFEGNYLAKFSLSSG